MQVRGIVKNGVVVLEEGHSFPDGARVFIEVLSPGRVQLPLVSSDNPGSVAMTNERIAEILDEEDAAPRA